MPEETATQEPINTETQTTQATETTETTETNTDTNENTTDTGNNESESQQSVNEPSVEIDKATEQGQATKETTGAEQPGDELTEEGRNIKNILAAAELNPAAANDPAVAKIVEMANKKLAGQEALETIL